MSNEDTERTLGRVLEGIENIKTILAQFHTDLYGDKGIESRLRGVENDMGKVKWTASLLAFVVSVFSAIGIRIFGK